MIGGILVAQLSAGVYSGEKLRQVTTALVTADHNTTNQENAIGIGSAELETQIIRFHVRANSNTASDQALKMQVKEKVLAVLAPYLEDAESVEESRQILKDNMTLIQETAENTIQENGYEYPVNVYFTHEEFPMKQYGDMVFPAGEYEALRIDIGEAEGKNWWCVMYPGLCFVDAANAIVPEDSKEQIQNVVSDETYQELLQNSTTEVKVHVRFKLAEELQAMFAEER